MARIFSYRGKSAEELKVMGNQDYSKLLTSRQRRALKRQGMDYKKLLGKVDDAKKSGGTVRTTIREAVILPSWIGVKFAVHNGKEFKEFVIVPEMMGHRLGEFSFSTKRVQHSAPGIRATRGSKFLAVK